MMRSMEDGVPRWRCLTRSVWEIESLTSHQEIWVRDQNYRPFNSVLHVQWASTPALWAVNTDTLRHDNCAGHVKTLCHSGHGISRSVKSLQESNASPVASDLALLHFLSICGYTISNCNYHACVLSDSLIPSTKNGDVCFGSELSVKSVWCMSCH